MLSLANRHERDSNITFEEEGHLYTLFSNTHPTSVTSFIHHYFPQFNADAVIDKMMASKNWSKSKYFGMSKSEISNKWKNDGTTSSSLGTLMHADIERYLNQEQPLNSSNLEFQYFIKFWTDFCQKYPSFRPYRTEWVIYDEDISCAGSIDCVLADNNNNLIILDWKRSKEIKMQNRSEHGFEPFENYDNCNYSHYSLQLNFYRHMLMSKYHYNVVYMMLVVLHPQNETYQCYPVPYIELGQIWPKLTVHKK